MRKIIIALTGLLPCSLVLGIVLATGPASAAVGRPAILTASHSTGLAVESSDIAGYQTSRWTRQITATFNLPTNNACAHEFYPRSPDGDGFALTLGNAEESNAGVPYTSDGPASTVGLSFVPSLAGCGLISPSFASNTPGYSSADQFGATPGLFLPGDNVTLQLGYSKGGEVTWATVTDNTQGQSVHSTFNGKYNYTSGSATAGFGPYSPQSGSAKLWAVKDVQIATYTGHLGAIGAFKAQVINLTSNGNSTGVTYVAAKALWNAGQNFSVTGN